MRNGIQRRANRVKRKFAFAGEMLFNYLLRILFVVLMFAVLMNFDKIFAIYSSFASYTGGKVVFWLLVLALLALPILAYIYVPAILGGLLSAVFSKKSSKEEKKPEKKETKEERSVENYQSRSLLTETENIFYQYLIEELKDYDASVMTKVRLEDLAKVKANTREEYMRARGYIKSRHVDFVIVNRKMEVICGIEVDDKSHEAPEAKEIDQFKNNLFKKLGLELYRIVNMDKLKEAAKFVKNNLVERNMIFPKENTAVEATSCGSNSSDKQKETD